MTPIQPAKGRAKSRWPLPLLWSRSGVIQLKGDGTTPASTRRIEASPTRKSTYRRPRSVIACANLFIGLKNIHFLWGGSNPTNSLAPAVVMPLRTLAKRCMRLSPLLAAPAALLLIQGEAKAVLT
jgi:hypothetical protein